MKKRVFYTEAAYILGTVLVAMGAALMEKADFGVSMVVAPAYLMYRWLNPYWEVFTYGMAEYFLQAILLVITVVVMRRFRVGYLFSFVTAVAYGLCLDLFMSLAAYIPASSLAVRGVCYAAGMSACSAGVSMMFHTYISPEVYELFVKEVSARYDANINKFKMVYDIVSTLIGIAMSFAIFGMWKFVGVSWGTAVCALLNGWLIGRFSKLYEKLWDFKDALPWRGFFEGKAK